MTPLHRLRSRFSQWDRLQTLRRHLPGHLSRRTIVLVGLVVLIGALAITASPVLIPSGESPPPASGPNESATDPGAQFAHAIAAEGTHLSNDLHQQPPDPTPNTGTESGDDDERGDDDSGDDDERGDDDSGDDYDDNSPEVNDEAATD